ncbi:hypothetical protein MTO96_051172 [Rhipicephalus appendiculatus]
MDNSEEGSLLFPATARFRRSTTGPEVQGWSPPSPWSPPPARWHRRLAHGSESTSRSTPEDESYVSDSYVANTGSYAILYPPARKLSHEPSHYYDTGATRRRHVSLPSRPLSTGDAVRARSSVSPEPSTPSQRLHRSRVQSIELDDRQNDTSRRTTPRHSARGLYQDLDDDGNFQQDTVTRDFRRFHRLQVHLPRASAEEAAAEGDRGTEATRDLCSAESARRVAIEKRDTVISALTADR